MNEPGISEFLECDAQLLIYFGIVSQDVFLTRATIG
jgi:hypothetical protein